jgi:cobalt-zinc-cadmium efflux system protein
MSYPHSQIKDVTRQATTRLATALTLTLLFVIFEALAGWRANSLALLTDAAHNFTDVIALGLSWYALRMTLRPANSRRTYGYHRVGILVALVNSSTLILIALGIFYEAYRRLLVPPQVESGILIVVGAIAFVINLVTAWMVKQGSERDLNLRSAFVHLMGDVLSTLGAMLAGVIIWFTGMNWLDPLVSVFIGLLIVWNAWNILRETVDILLESTPRDIDMDQMVLDMSGVEGVRGVHDLHVWSIAQNVRTLSAHVLIDNVSIGSGAEIQRAIGEVLDRKYGIGHATLQLECEDCMPDQLYCDILVGKHDHLPAQN